MSHTSQEALQKKIENALRRIKIGQLYYHYKNPKKLYVIEFIGLLEEREEICVGYRALYGPGLLWVRDLANFLTKVDVEGKKINRFNQIRR